MSRAAGPGADSTSGRGSVVFRSRLVCQLAIVAAVVSLAFVAGSLFMRAAQEETHARVKQQQSQLHQESLSTVVGLRGLTLRNFVADYSLWGDMAVFVETPDPVWAANNLDASLATFKLSYLWVFDPRGALRFHATSSAPLRDLPGAEGGASMLPGSAFTHYFVRLADGTLLEVRGARVQPEKDKARTSEALGYLFAAIRWDAAHVEELRALIGGDPFIVEATSACAALPGDSAMVVGHDLPGREGPPVARLCMRVPDPSADLMTTFERRSFLASLAFAGALFATLSVLLHLLVVRPVRRIGAALSTGDPSSLAPLEVRSDEFGDLARAVIEHQRGVREREVLRAQVFQAGKLASLGVLGSGVAHELNNPLAAVLGHADMLAMACEAGALDPDEVRESASAIVQQAERMRVLVDHVRALDRTESGPPRLVLTRLDDLARDALVFLRRHLEVRKVGVTFRLARDLPLVAVDKVMVELVVQNLVLNAADELENLEEGRPRTVTVETALGREDGVALLRVIDDGRGIPEALRDRVFEPFFTTKPVGKGTGLGLTLAREMLERHGGTLTFTSSGAGTTFEMALPLAPVPNPMIPHG